MLGRPNTTGGSALVVNIGLRRLFVCLMLLKARHGGDSLSMKVFLSISSLGSQDIAREFPRLG